MSIQVDDATRKRLDNLLRGRALSRERMSIGLVKANAKRLKDPLKRQAMLEQMSKARQQSVARRKEDRENLFEEHAVAPRSEAEIRAELAQMLACQLQAQAIRWGKT